MNGHSGPQSTCAFETFHRILNLCLSDAVTVTSFVAAAKSERVPSSVTRNSDVLWDRFANGD
jgi:hypothetical protein